MPKGKTLSVTDLVFENSRARDGVIVLQRNDDALLVLDLVNFRYLDYHFVTPIALKAGDKLQLVCTRQPCTGAAVYYAGGSAKVIKKKPSAKGKTDK